MMILTSQLVRRMLLCLLVVLGAVVDQYVLQPQAAPGHLAGAALTCVSQVNNTCAGMRTQLA
jgi:hypothetical protein